MMAIPTIRVADVDGCSVPLERHTSYTPAVAALLNDPVELSNACRAFYKTRVEAAARMKERAQRRGSSSSSSSGNDNSSSSNSNNNNNNNNSGGNININSISINSNGSGSSISSGDYSSNGNNNYSGNICDSGNNSGSENSNSSKNNKSSSRNNISTSGSSSSSSRNRSKSDGNKNSSSGSSINNSSSSSSCSTGSSDDGSEGRLRSGSGGGGCCVGDSMCNNSSSSGGNLGAPSQNLPGQRDADGDDADLHSCVTSCVSNGEHAQARRRAMRERSAMDTAMAVLRREMASLMDLDLRLMKQLLILNEEIEDLKWRRRRACSDNCGSSQEGSWDMMQSAASLSSRLEVQPALKFSTPSSLSLQLEGDDSVRFSVYDDEDNNNTFNRGKTQQQLQQRKQQQQEQQQHLHSLTSPNAPSKACITAAVSDVGLDFGQADSRNGVDESEKTQHTGWRSQAFEVCGKTKTCRRLHRPLQNGNGENQEDAQSHGDPSNLPCSESKIMPHFNSNLLKRNKSCTSSEKDDMKQGHKEKQMSYQISAKEKLAFSKHEKLSSNMFNRNSLSLSFNPLRDDETKEANSGSGDTLQKLNPAPTDPRGNLQYLHSSENIPSVPHTCPKVYKDCSEKELFTDESVPRSTTKTNPSEANTQSKRSIRKTNPPKISSPQRNQNVKTKTNPSATATYNAIANQSTDRINPPESCTKKANSNSLEKRSSSPRAMSAHTGPTHNDHITGPGLRKKSKGKFVFRPGNSKLLNANAARQPKKKVKELTIVSNGDAESHDSGINDVFN